MPSSGHTKGAWYVGLAYTLWGFFPIYWKALAGISSLQLICHRIVWSLLLLLVMVGRSKEWSALWDAIRTPRVLAVYTVAAVAIAVNWLIFVWAVGINQIVQISLGYFINPLLSVVLGMLIFHERLRKLQWVSVSLAAAGVLYLTVALQALPWISLTLAATFATYGLMKKLAPLGPVQGLALETGILFAPAAIYLVVEQLGRARGFSAFGAVARHADARLRADHNVSAAALRRGRSPHSAVARRDASVHQSHDADFHWRPFCTRSHSPASNWSDSALCGVRWCCLRSKVTPRADGRGWA